MFIIEKVVDNKLKIAQEFRFLSDPEDKLSLRAHHITDVQSYEVDFTRTIRTSVIFAIFDNRFCV